MQIVSFRDKFAWNPKPIFWEKYISMLSAENFTQNAKR